MDYLYKIYFTLVLWFCLTLINTVRLIIYLGIYKPKKNSDYKKLRIIFLENQPDDQAGNHYRVKLVSEYLNNDGIETSIKCCFNKKEFSSLHKYRSDRFLILSKMLIKKLIVILKSKNFDLVIVRRELLHQCQYGGFHFEKLLLAMNKKTILDIDDFMPDHRIERTKKSFFNYINLYSSHKALKSLNFYENFTVATKNYFENLNLIEKKVHFFPMCLDYKISLKNYRDLNNSKKIGWISSSRNFHRLDNIVEYLNKAYKKLNFEIIVIADLPYKNEKLNVPVKNLKWSLENEIEYLLKIDIGISPISEKNNSNSKTGTMKLVQYMALGIVSISSSLPFTKLQIIDGENGFLVENDYEWELTLLKVLNMDNQKLKEIGKNGYNFYLQNHCLKNQYDDLKGFYNNIINQY